MWIGKIEHSKAERWINCKAVPVGAKGKLNSRNGCAVVARRHGKMLPDVGMVQMYSKSVNVNDLGFAWIGWPPSLHGPALLLVPMFFLPGGLPCPSEAHCTIPTSALVFGGNIIITITYVWICRELVAMQARTAERGVRGSPPKILVPGNLLHRSSLASSPSTSYNPNLRSLSGGICWLYVAIQLPTPQVV